MGKFMVALSELKGAGLEILDNNKKVICHSDNAKIYTGSNWDWLDGTARYILGSVPADTELLSNVEFDLMFLAIEGHADNFPTFVYEKLHKLAESLDIQDFLDRIDKEDAKAKLIDVDDDTFLDMHEEIESRLHDIVTEVSEMTYMISEEEVS